MKLTVAHRSVPAQGETKNGDRAIYRNESESHLFGVVDGLGHGPGADEASGQAVAFLSQCSLDDSLRTLMEGAHRALAGTRGAAATICIIRRGRIEACAVGNVELRSGALRIPLVASPGVLGARVSKFRVCEAKVQSQARLILFSDGISSRVRFDEHARLEPNELCDQIIEEHRKDYDDSTILVADVEPPS